MEEKDTGYSLGRFETDALVVWIRPGERESGCIVVSVFDDFECVGGHLTLEEFDQLIAVLTHAREEFQRLTT